jgi:hypothetical protein
MESVGLRAIVAFFFLPDNAYSRIDKRMINPSQVPNWIVIVYERQQRFNDQVANQLATDLVRACEAVGAASN